MSAAALWTAYEAAAATGGALCARGSAPRAGDDVQPWPAERWAADGVSIDTRSLSPGELFVALQDARDGHDFLPEAFAAGAAAALVARAPENAPAGAPLLVVGDTLEGLRDLARAARLRNFGKRIAVTGSVGKTSVKEILRALLTPTGVVHAAAKSFNNHWGVPLTLAALPARADFGVFEIGMNHAGEITPLTRLVAPHVAIVTTVAAAHLEFFDGIEGIAEAKAEIFLGLTPGGAAVLPADNAYFDLLKKRAEEAGARRLVTFGESPAARYRLLAAAPGPAGMRLRVSLDGDEREITTGLPGRHQAINLLAAIAAIDAAGADREPAIAAAARLAPAEGRGARTLLRFEKGEATLIDESYNANPASMTAAIALLGAASPGAAHAGEPGRRIAVLGEMLELGPDAPALHAAIADDLIAAKVDLVFAAGPLMAHLWTRLPPEMRALRADSAIGLIGAVEDEVRAGDMVMVKGSNASKVSAVAKALEARSRRSEF